jgi:hypothetical protein
MSDVKKARYPVGLRGFASLFWALAISAISGCEWTPPDNGFELCCGYVVSDNGDEYWIEKPNVAERVVLSPSMLVQVNQTEFAGTGPYTHETDPPILRDYESRMKRVVALPPSRSMRCVYFHLDLKPPETLYVFATADALKTHLGDRLKTAVPMRALYLKAHCDIDPANLLD